MFPHSVFFLGWSFGFYATGYKKVRNLIGLFDAVCDVYDRTDFKPNSDGTTHCNQAVQAVAVSAFGYHGLDGMLADEIIDFLQESSDWAPIIIHQAQDYANQGSLILAGLNSTDLKQAHGHIVIIRPGIECDSGKWGKVPRCVNIGASNFLARGQKGVMTNLSVGVNEAFSAPMPKCWVLRSSL